jgi:hypothetical protein
MNVNARRQRVARLSAVTRVAALVLAGVLPALAAAYWGFASDAEIARSAGLAAPAVALGLPERIGAAIISALSPLALSWGLVRLAAALGHFGAGAPFVPAAARGLRDFSLGVVACTILKVLAGAALSVLVSWSATGQRQIAVSISSDMVLMLLVGAVMALMGWALSEATALADENAQFV